MFLGCSIELHGIQEVATAVEIIGFGKSGLLMKVFDEAPVIGASCSVSDACQNWV